MSDNRNTDRRRFLQWTVAASTTAGLPVGVSTAVQAVPQVRNYRRLGRTELQISDISFGCSRLRKDGENLIRHALERGIIIADTKMEFGMIEGSLYLIDELLTPDSSRFWDAEGYAPGKSQPNFDKQFVRDWLDEQGWDHEPPAPELPDDIVERTHERYLEAYRRLTGNELA